MNATKNKKIAERYCTVEESLIQSLKEVKLMQAGLMPKKPWNVFEKEMREFVEKVKNGEKIAKSSSLGVLQFRGSKVWEGNLDEMRRW